MKAVAGLGASFVASGSSLVAVIFAVFLGVLYDQTIVPLAVSGIASRQLSAHSLK